jgi:hypothetical protein
MSNTVGQRGARFRWVRAAGILGIGLLVISAVSHAGDGVAQRQEAVAWATVQREGFGPAIGVTQPIVGGDYEKAEAADGEDPHTATRERPQGSE